AWPCFVVAVTADGSQAAVVAGFNVFRCVNFNDRPHGRNTGEALLSFLLLPTLKPFLDQRHRCAANLVAVLDANADLPPGGPASKGCGVVEGLPVDVAVPAFTQALLLGGVLRRQELHDA